MKKFIGFLSLAVVLTLMSYSCRPETKKEVIIVPSKTEVIVKEPEKKTTTITVDKNGVKVEARKVDVTIKKDKQ